MDPKQLLASVASAWQEADSRKFAAHFTESGLFVAFDGAVHVGREAIGTFHQVAFEGPLRGTALAMEVTMASALGPDLQLILTRGGICEAGRTRAGAATDSVQTLIVRRSRWGDGSAAIAYFPQFSVASQACSAARRESSDRRR